MKVLKHPVCESKSFVLTLDADLCARLDDVARKYSAPDGMRVYRSDVIRAVLEAALQAKDFTIVIKK